MDNIVRALRQVSAETPGYHVRVCLENMAGQGTNLGYTFEQARLYLDGNRCAGNGWVSVFDTAMYFAAGYDIRSAEAYAETMDTFDRVVGLDQIRCFHFNDSKYPLDSRRDRHEHIGQGIWVQKRSPISSTTRAGPAIPLIWKHLKPRRTTMVTKRKWIGQLANAARFDQA